MTVERPVLDQLQVKVGRTPDNAAVFVAGLASGDTPGLGLRHEHVSEALERLDVAPQWLVCSDWATQASPQHTLGKQQCRAAASVEKQQLPTALDQAATRGLR